jgi:hypothetical protein
LDNFLKIILILFFYFNLYFISKERWGWGLGIGDWGLGIGDWAHSPIPVKNIFC